MKRLLEEESRRQRERYLCREAYERREERRDYGHGYSERDLVARFGTLRLRIREAFLRGISTRDVGRAAWSRTCPNC